MTAVVVAGGSGGGGRRASRNVLGGALRYCGFENLSLHAVDGP